MVARDCVAVAVSASRLLRACIHGRQQTDVGSSAAGKPREQEDLTSLPAPATPSHACSAPSANTTGQDQAPMSASSALPNGAELAVPLSRTSSGVTVEDLRKQYSPVIVAVAGGTASGKTTVCELIIQRLHDQCCALINQDSFYKVLNEEQKRLVKEGKYDFDSPDAIDEPALIHCLDQLRSGQPYELPVYDFTTHSRKAETRRMDPAQVIIVEGILVLHYISILERAQLKIFVDSDDDVRLARRIQRDVGARGRDVSEVIDQYNKYVKPAHDHFIAPSRKKADIIIPWQRRDNLVAVDLVVGHIKSNIVQDVLLERFGNLHLVDSSFQMRGMHTIMRNKETDKSEFIFMADRLIRLVVEYALGLLPTEKTTVLTHTNSSYEGLRINAKMCGVSIIRSGEAMEGALRSCWKGADIGKILVYRSHHHVHRHRNSGAAEDGGTAAGNHRRRPSSSTERNGNFYRGAHRGPGEAGGIRGETALTDLVYEKLPHDIADRYVLLMDPILGTGQTVAQAITVLLGKGVKEANILYLTLIGSRQGLFEVCSRYPLMKVITTEIDPDLDSSLRVLPGIGEFGDRYFCA